MPILCLLLLFILTSYDLCELSYNYINSVYPLFLFNQNNTFSKLISTNNKSFSSCTKQTELTQTEFYQWFAGFTDGEGNFDIHVRKDSNSISIQFRITIHVDDVAVLYFIRDRLGGGTVQISNTRNEVVFKVTGVANLQEFIIKPLSIFKLNGTKYLDFLVFKEVLEIMSTKAHLTTDGQAKISKLLETYNTKRIEFNIPKDHSITITPYYLLGLIEAEGSFSYGTNNQLSFVLVLTESQQHLIKAIKLFIDNLSVDTKNPLPLKIDRALIVYRKAPGIGKGKPSFAVQVSDFYFLINFLIPFLKNLTWVSKKQKDFHDWVLISQLMAKGLHLTGEGLSYILAIKSRMNNGRLSTNQNNPKYLNLPLPNFDPFSLKNLYELTTDGLLKEVSSSRIITNVKYYKLTEVTNINNIFYITPAELVKFIGYSKFTVYRSLSENNYLKQKGTGLLYSVTKLY